MNAPNFQGIYICGGLPVEVIKMPPSSPVNKNTARCGVLLGLMVTNAEICKSRWKTSAQCKTRAKRGEFVFRWRKNNRLISLPGECLHWGLSCPHRDHFSLDGTETLPGFAQISAGEDQEKGPLALDTFISVCRESVRRGKNCAYAPENLYTSRGSRRKKKESVIGAAPAAAVCWITDKILCGFGPLGTNMGVMCFVRSADAPASIRAKCFRLPRYSPLSLLSFSHTQALVRWQKRSGRPFLLENHCCNNKDKLFLLRESSFIWGHVRHYCVLWMVVEVPLLCLSSAHALCFATHTIAFST